MILGNGLSNPYYQYGPCGVKITLELSSSMLFAACFSVSHYSEMGVNGGGKDTKKSQMPRHLINDAHEWMNEISAVPIYYLLAKTKPRERAWQN